MATPEHESEVELDTYRFEKELQHGLKIVNFYAPWYCTVYFVIYISHLEAVGYVNRIVMRGDA